MKLSEVSIHRPVFATVMSLVVVLVGLVGYSRLTVREYPNIDPPVVTVKTTYQGASAPIVETQVTKVLEDSLSGIEGIDYITSISREEESQISIRFDLERDPDSAAADVRDRVGRERGHLPDEIEEPVIQKIEADAQPILYIAFHSDRHSALEITDYADRYVKDQLQTLPGVADVRLFGEREYSMRIWLDPERLAAYNLTPQDVENALRRQNVDVPAGRIESVAREFTVLSETDLKTPEQFDNLILKDAKGYLVRLSDVGHAELGALDERRIVRSNGLPAIALGVVKQATANPLDVSNEVAAALPGILASLPEGMKVEVAHDKSIFIRESVKNVYTTIGEAILLVVLIIFLFLRSYRATLIPLVTIPVSLIGAFGLMYALDFSINTLTLLALVLAIGLVVDDAIVMLENIYRHVEDGDPPLEAALVGSKEIGFAVLAMTLTLAAVYAPIGFMAGTTGRLFTEFAWTLAGAVIVSGFVALTLTPMMCSKLLNRSEKHGWVYRAIEAALRGLTSGYRALIRGALKVRPLILLIGLAVAGSSYFLFGMLKSELAPTEDQGFLVGIIVAPEGSTIEYTDTYAKQLEKIFSKVPEAERYFVVSGRPTVSQGTTFLKLKPWGERKRSQREIAASITPEMTAIPGVIAFPSSPPPLGQGVRDKPIQFVIQTSRPYDELQVMVDKMLDKAAENPGLVNVDTDLKLNSPQLEVNIDREKAAAMGVEVDALGRTLETHARRPAGDPLQARGRAIRRRGQDRRHRPPQPGRHAADPCARPRQHHDPAVEPDDREGVGGAEGAQPLQPAALGDHHRASRAGIRLERGSRLSRERRRRRCCRRPPISTMPASRASSNPRARASTSPSCLALAFIYLVLAAQFESFKDPFIIMLTVPLSITGALLALWWSGGTLNIYSQVGLVTLIGLITKHGILIVEFSNQLRAQGFPIGEAVVEAATLRLRPILMTTGAMVLGAVPLALATGAGAESRQDIGWVIVGGLLVGTLFTLFVIPVVYTYLTSRNVHRATAEEERALAEALTLPERKRLEAAE